MDHNGRKKVALVLGAGDGIGRAISTRFALGGYHTVIVRRDASRSKELIRELAEKGAEASVRTADIRKENEMSALFSSVEEETGEIDVCVYNGGANTLSALEETSAKLFQKVWELCCLGGFLAVRESARVMGPRKRGTVIFSGATSGIRGKEGLTAFSSGKFGVRSVAQSAAKELAPQGIHVAHVMINGGVRSADIARLYKERADIDIDDLDNDLFIDMEALAEAYWFLSQQPKTCWTHELDIRTYREKW